MINKSGRIVCIQIITNLASSNLLAFDALKSWEQNKLSKQTFQSAGGAYILLLQNQGTADPIPMR